MSKVIKAVGIEEAGNSQSALWRKTTMICILEVECSTRIPGKSTSHSRRSSPPSKRIFQVSNIFDEFSFWFQLLFLTCLTTFCIGSIKKFVTLVPIAIQFRSPMSQDENLLNFFNVKSTGRRRTLIIHISAVSTRFLLVDSVHSDVISMIILYHTPLII